MKRKNSLLHLITIGIIVAAVAYIPFNAFAWTDDPLKPGTPIKAIHILEIRDAISKKRMHCYNDYLSQQRNWIERPIVFTDQSILPLETPVKKEHIEELRQQLLEFTFATVNTPIFTDPDLMTSQTPIKAIHITELRHAAVTAPLRCKCSVFPEQKFCKSCDCTPYKNGACMAGGCAAGKRQQTRTCKPSGCNTESICVSDKDCEPPSCKFQRVIPGILCEPDACAPLYGACAPAGVFICQPGNRSVCALGTAKMKKPTKEQCNTICK
ncbi:MAG: hypothetical protein AABZ06_02520 [Bdellovibrionota bacterium]